MKCARDLENNKDGIAHSLIKILNVRCAVSWVHAHSHMISAHASSYVVRFVPFLNQNSCMKKFLWRLYFEMKMAAEFILIQNFFILMKEKWAGVPISEGTHMGARFLLWVLLSSAFHSYHYLTKIRASSSTAEPSAPYVKMNSTATNPESVFSAISVYFIYLAQGSGK